MLGASLSLSLSLSLFLFFFHTVTLSLSLSGSVWAFAAPVSASASVHVHACARYFVEAPCSVYHDNASNDLANASLPQARCTSRLVNESTIVSIADSALCKYT